MRVARAEGGSGHEPGKQQRSNIPGVREGLPGRWPYPDSLTTRRPQQAGDSGSQLLAQGRSHVALPVPGSQVLQTQRQSQVHGFGCALNKEVQVQPLRACCSPRGVPGAENLGAPGGSTVAKVEDSGLASLPPKPSVPTVSCSHAQVCVQPVPQPGMPTAHPPGYDRTLSGPRRHSPPGSTPLTCCLCSGCHSTYHTT